MFKIFFAGNYFTYNSIDSEFYNLKLVIKDTAGIESMGGEVTYKKTKQKGLQTETIQRIDYDTPLSFDIEMMADVVLTDEQVREIYYHYFNSQIFRSLYINDEDWAGIYFDCTINNVTKIHGGIGEDYGVIGFKATVTCSSPWALEDTQDKDYTGADVKTTGMEFLNISDCKDYMYPILTIVTGANCTEFSITNTSDENRVLSFAEVTNGDNSLKSQTIIINPLTGTVLSGSTSKYANFNKRYFRLVQGLNIFGITSTPVSNVTSLKITYQNARVVL